MDGYRWLGAPLSAAVVKAWYPSRKLLPEFAGLTEAARQRASAAAEANWDKMQNDPAFHPAAVAHFAGFWADENEEGSGDAQNVRALLLLCCWC